VSLKFRLLSSSYKGSSISSVVRDSPFLLALIRRVCVGVPLSPFGVNCASISTSSLSWCARQDFLDFILILEPLAALHRALLPAAYCPDDWARAEEFFFVLLFYTWPIGFDISEELFCEVLDAMLRPIPPPHTSVTIFDFTLGNFVHRPIGPAFSFSSHRISQLKTGIVSGTNDVALPSFIVMESVLCPSSSKAPHNFFNGRQQKSFFYSSLT